MMEVNGGKLRMKTTVWCVLVGILGLFVASASASTLYTSLIVGPNADLLFCSIVNTSTAAHTITVEIVDANGIVASTNTLSVAAQGAASFSVNPSSTAGYFCKFSVTKKSSFRAEGFLLNTTNLRTYAIYPAE